MLEWQGNPRMKEIEKKVVASVLHEETVAKFAKENEVDVRFFDNPGYQKIMSIYNSLNAGQMEPSISIIIEQMDPKTEEERERLVSFFENLKTEVVDIKVFQVYMKMMVKNFKSKRYWEFAVKLQNIVENEELSPLDSKYDEMEKQIDFEYSSIMEEYSKTDKVVMNMKQGFQAVMENMNETLTTNTNNTYTTTGYKEINKAFNGGHVRGAYTIYAGRPAMGKTVVMLNEAVEAAQSGAKVGFISIEMTAVQCFQRIVAKIAGIDGERILQPAEMEPEDWKKLREAASKVGDIFDSNFFIIEVAQLTVNRMKRLVNEHKENFGCDLFYIDYFQIMSNEKGEKPEKESEYAAISEGIRITAKTEMVALVIGSQLSRDIEKRDDKTPKLSDLRNTGTLEQDAYRVVGIYRDEYYNPDKTEEPNMIRYIILKNRDGAVKTIKLKYIAKRQSVFSMVA